jgi:protein required for attachment to host cells
MKKVMWLLVANAAQAEIYAVDKRDFTLVKSYTHSQSRLKSGDLTSDKAGHYKTGAAGHGQFEPHSDAHNVEQEHFAKELAGVLEHARQANEYQVLVVCAGPHFHGLLNKEMTKMTIEKDYIPLHHKEKEDAIQAIVNELPTIL